MKYAYPACFYPERDGGFSVVFVDFELATFGPGLADAMHMAADAAAGRILSILRDGEGLPPPTNPKEVTPDEAEGFVSMVYIDMSSQKDEKLVKKTLTIPSWLNNAAEKKNVNFSATLKEALIEKIAL